VAAFAGVRTDDLLVSAMKVNQENHRYIASNIANVETPHYNPIRLDFQATLRSMLEGRARVGLRTTEARQTARASIRPKLERVAQMSKNDGNKVDLEDQTAKLAENTGQYVVYSSLLAKNFERAKSMLSSIR
jgi:flagellar basal-body rod protein FlgB